MISNTGARWTTVILLRKLNLQHAIVSIRPAELVKLFHAAAQLANLVDEIVRTRGSMRFQISPEYVFDERWDDLVLCFELDNYRLEYVGPGRLRYSDLEGR